jgi:hypothetical protein
VVLVSLMFGVFPAHAQTDDGGAGKPKPTTPAAQPKSGESEKDRIKREGQELFKGAGGQGGGGAAAGDASGWAIVIAACRGEGREQAAAQMLAKARTEGGLPEAYTARRNEAVVIAVGDFVSPDDERARVELKRIQGMEIGGVRPYVGAMLAPPLDFKMTGSMPQFNLLRAKEQFGANALYTLQIGVYGRMDVNRPKQAELVEPRKAAEQAALKLRQEGEQAWYYHGPTMSMVCVGVFDQTDFDPRTPNLKSAKLREAQKRYPNNLYNGAGIKEKHKGEKEKLQPSNLVEIPKQ